jgi:hypothetical protein
VTGTHPEHKLVHGAVQCCRALVQARLHLAADLHGGRKFLAGGVEATEGADRDVAPRVVYCFTDATRTKHLEVCKSKVLILQLPESLKTVKVACWLLTGICCICPAHLFKAVP